MKFFKCTFALVAICFFGFSSPNQATAQEDFDKMFEQMMREFFPEDLLKEIDSIRENEDSKAKPKQSFFKNDPRFLAIKERQIRERRKDRLEKQHPTNLLPFRPLARQISGSVAAIFDGDKKDRIAFATAISDDGYLVTKASELNGLKKVRCVISTSKEFQAEVVRVDKTNDLALLKTTEKLKSIKLTHSGMDEGTLLVTVDNSDLPVAMGTLAVKPRSIIGKNRGFLGVEPAPHSKGVLIKTVTPNSAAQNAGIRDGDVVTSINQVPTRTVAELVREIGSKKKGNKIQLSIIRGSTQKKIEATLNGRMISGDRAARFEMMRRLGAVLSKRRDEFPSVIEHDTPILPDECGTPIVDLEGNVVGINIARAGRTNSYAIPMNLVKDLLESHRS